MAESTLVGSERSNEGEDVNTKLKRSRLDDLQELMQSIWDQRELAEETGDTDRYRELDYQFRKLEHREWKLQVELGYRTNASKPAPLRV